MLRKVSISVVLSMLIVSMFGQTNSVLSEGDIYKIGVPSAGIYKITRDYLANTLGVNPDTINPAKIKIYGNGGAMLPQPNSIARYNDPEENNIYVSGEADGSFDHSDYILFYAQGTVNWGLSSDSSRLEHALNIYSDTSYYFIKLGGTNGKRIASVPSASGATVTLSDFDEYLLYEKENYNVLKSGRTWYSDRFDFQLNQNFGINLPGYQTSSAFSMTSSLVGDSPINSFFSINMNGSSVGTQSFSGRGNGPYHLAGKNDKTTFTNLTSSSSSLNLDFIYNTSGAADATGYIDYLEFNYKRPLVVSGSSLDFRSIASLNQDKTGYQITGANSGMVIWNITDPLHPSEQQYTLSGSTASFVEDQTELQEYILFQGNSFANPVFIKKVESQNLHAINVPELLIITHPDFKVAAQRLADFRSQNDAMDVEIVTIEKVYNEFSSGKQDITAIRDFTRSIHLRDGNSTFKYLLLFGDCSYDYKNRISGNTNYIPVYESIESLNPLSTYSSDDYFGFLDDAEGGWSEIPADKDKLNIGIGRVICKTPVEAEAIVDKIIYYSTNQDILGKWKNEITLIADDGDGNIHLKDAEALALGIDNDFPAYNVGKIYVDAYQQIPTANGDMAPDVNEAINRKMNAGSFITNYTGHGGEAGLAHEKIMTIDQINAWDNMDKLTLMFTATCEFGRYDDPERVSAGEYTFLNPNGGSVAIITTSRPVNSHSNHIINTAFFANVFKPLPDGTMPRLGDLMINTKNESISGIGNRNFTLLGDPSMRLAYPKDKIVITQINDSTISSNSDTLKALSKVTFKGEVRNFTGSKLSTFNGKIDVKVFDKKASITTLGDENPVYNFNLYKDIIFNGKSSVTNGEFTFTFVVPKDISYQYGNGKISMYAQTDDLSKNTDAHGYNLDIVVGGSNANAVADNEPPLVESFMDDFTFVFGGITGTDPVLLAKLSDDNGINTAGSGIGHEITAVLDEDREGVIILNEYYEADLGSYKEGKVEYPLYDLAPGLHSVRVKAWDVYNNSAEDYLEFLVVENQGIVISNLLNFPNPFTTNTQFHFDHNRAGDDLDVKIQVLTLSGKVVKTLNFTSFSSPSHIESPITFDGKDEWGDQLARGVYIYKASIRSATDGEKVSEFEKLLLLK